MLNLKKIKKSYNAPFLRLIKGLIRLNPSESNNITWWIDEKTLCVRLAEIGGSMYCEDPVIRKKLKTAYTEPDDIRNYIKEMLHSYYDLDFDEIVLLNNFSKFIGSGQKEDDENT